MTRFSAALATIIVLALPAALQAQGGNLYVVPDGGQLHVAEPLLQLQERVTIERGPVDPNDARETRRQLQQLLTEHPPAVRIVLQADPSLIDRPDYLAPYPRLSAFLKQHPEVARDPAFFLGSAGFGFRSERTPQERALDSLESTMVGVAVFTAFMTVLLVLVSLVRQAMEHRRWARQSRVQTDVHTKILDRLQSNEDLMAYIQTPAGQRFLESGPSPRESAPPQAVAAPFGRILWSVQAGVMLIALGIALGLVQQNVMDEIKPAFQAMAIIAGGLGVGAVLSAAASYLISVRLGLLGVPKG